MRSNGMSGRHINILLIIFFGVLVLGFVVQPGHTFAGSLAGHIVGMAGTLIMSLALVYPFKKRVLGKRGRQNPLNRHIAYGLIGPSLVIVHSAHSLASTIAILTFLSMLIVVLSGIVGRFLFRKINRTLKTQKNDLQVLKTRLNEQKSTLMNCTFSLGEGGDEPSALQSEQADLETQDRCKELLNLLYSISELEYSVAAFNRTQALFSRWTRIHYYLALFLFSLITIHILANLYYGLRWAL